jgi:putative transposase
MERFGQPEVFNTDQGVQFTSAAFLDEQEGRGVRISMDSKGRFLDNIFIERLWRSLKHEEVFIKAYGSVAEARRGIGAWLAFYNNERPHQALDYRTQARCLRKRRPVDMWTTQEALPTCPQ